MYEVIIVDGSTNNIVYRFYKNKYSKYKVIKYIKKRSNLPEALNIGIKNMKGVFLKQLDSDDLLATRTALKEYYSYTKRHKDYLVFYSDAKIINSKNQTIRIEKEKSFDGLDLARRIWQGSIGYPSSYLIHRKAFNIVGLFNEKNLQAEDWEWRIRAVFLNNLSFLHIPKPLVAYRRHNMQKSLVEMRSSALYLYNMKLKLAEEIKHKIKEKEKSDLIKVSLTKALVSHIKRNFEIRFGIKDKKSYNKFIKPLEKRIGSV